MKNRKINLERKILELECISPVHVGNGEILKAFEYLYNRHEQKVYFLDETKWIHFLYKYDLIDEFAVYIEKISSALKKTGQFKGKNIWEWLNAQGINDGEIRALSIRQAETATNTIISSTKETLNDIECNISLSSGVPYIPGSSLKGLFRTAIMYSIIKKEPQKFQRYWRELISNTKNLNLKQINIECSKIIKKLENEIFSKLDYSIAERFHKKITNEVKSVMRGLMVSDAICDDEKIETIIIQKSHATTLDNRYAEIEKSLPIFYECIPSGTKFSFNITLDVDMMKVIGISSVDEIIKMTRNFIFDGLNRLEKVFGADYSMEFDEAETADALLGGGVGFLAKSLLYTLAPTHNDARIFAMNYFDKAFTIRHDPAHWHTVHDKKIAPRTLKLARTRSRKSLLGLVKFRGYENA